MTLLYVTAVVWLAVGAGLAATCALCLELEQLVRAVDELETRLIGVAPYLGAAAIFFLLKWVTHEPRLRVSYAIGWNITDSLYAVEGTFVAALQTAVPDPLYAVLSGMYVFGFTYLLFAAAVLTFLLPSQRRFKELLIAYLLNYSLGAVCYTLFIAYGPRIWISTRVDGLLYQLYPQTQTLTSAVASNTNVFPSLHTSLSVVVLLFAWRTRRAYPRWVPIASLVAAGVVLSTMVLGIHWLTDVVAGVALGAWSVVAASRIVASVDGDGDGGPAPTAVENDPSDVADD